MKDKILTPAQELSIAVEKFNKQVESDEALLTNWVLVFNGVHYHEQSSTSLSHYCSYSTGETTSPEVAVGLLETIKFKLLNQFTQPEVWDEEDEDD